MRRTGLAVTDSMARGDDWRRHQTRSNQADRRQIVIVKAKITVKYVLWAKLPEIQSKHRAAFPSLFIVDYSMPDYACPAR